MQKKFNKILVANRGEIAIRIFRACAELGIKSVGIYSKEDKYSLFRTKADESYLIGEDKGPIDVYLDMDGIIALAKEKNVDAIYGSTSVAFSPNSPLKYIFTSADDSES